ERAPAWPVVGFRQWLERPARVADEELVLLDCDALAGRGARLEVESAAGLRRDAQTQIRPGLARVPRGDLADRHREPRAGDRHRAGLVGASHVGIIVLSQLDTHAVTGEESPGVPM